MQIFSIDSNIPMLSEILSSSNSTVKENRIINIFSNGEISNQKLIDDRTEFLIVRSTVRVDKDLLDGTNVKFVATATTGTDHIDIEYLDRQGIIFCSADGANSNSVAEYVIYSILLHYSRYKFRDLDKKTVGIIGFGNIGRKVAKYLELMGITFLVCDPFVEQEKGINDKSINFCNIDKIIEICDIITSHVPFTVAGEHCTCNLLNATRINKIKDDALLICSSRGGVCDEVAMLERKNILNYVVDVWSDEPYITNRELIDVALLATPHIAGHSYQGKLNGTLMIIEKLNGIFKMNLDLTNILDDLKSKHLFDKNEFTNYNMLFNALCQSRQLESTSLKMKQHWQISNDDFKVYFKNERANYPVYFEIISI